MSVEFDIKWLSLSVDGTDGLDEVVAAERRAPEAAPQDGRFEALLASHLRWASSAGGQVFDQGLGAEQAPGDASRSSRIAREVTEQLARIAEVGVAA